MEQNQEKETVKISKKSLYVGVAMVAVALLIGGYFAFFNKKNPENPAVLSNDSLNAKKDSALMKNDSIPDEEGEYHYQELRIIANEIPLPGGQTLKFGDKVFGDTYNGSDDEMKIYLNNPYKVPNTQLLTINSDMFVWDSEFGDYKKYFAIPPYSTLPFRVKKLLFNQNEVYKNNKVFRLTQNAERMKSTLAVGDFDGDGVKDYAIVLDSNEGEQESYLMIISTNKNTNSAYVSYSAQFSDRLKINAFSKGASIYMNSESFVKAPIEGVLVRNEYGATAVIYDTKNQKFQMYEQEPLVPEAEVSEEEYD